MWFEVYLVIKGDIYGEFRDIRMYINNKGNLEILECILIIKGI